MNEILIENKKDGRKITKCSETSSPQYSCVVTKVVRKFPSVDKSVKTDGIVQQIVIKLKGGT